MNCDCYYSVFCWSLVDQFFFIRGSGRFSRLWNAAVRGAHGPPADLRYLAKPRSLVAGESGTGKVTSFLQSLYESVAETLPDVRDEPSLEYAFKGNPALESTDPYAILDLVQFADEGGPPRAGKVRKYKKGLKLHVERRPENSGFEVRYLPPGTMKEYFEQFQCVDGQISFATFWRVWRVEFDHLKFRGVTSHSQCSTCIHHRALLKELAPYLHARQRQADLFHGHLMSQYRDRQTYWALRGSSRLRVIGHVVLIQDGMDQVKFSIPRSRLYLAKDLNTLNRPKLGIVGVICHGHSLVIAVSNPTHPKDSSCMAELLCHVLTRLERSGVRLQNTIIHLIADNTSRETKNNTSIRLLSALTQRRSLMFCMFVSSRLYCFCTLHCTTAS